jgi:prepilin-type N-terminal cleavage/methylation domain-containing protein
MTNYNKKGFTLIEAIVALLIFSLSAGSIMLLVSQNFKTNRRAKNYIIAETAFYKTLYEIYTEDLLEESDFNIKCDEFEDINCNVNISVLKDSFTLNKENISITNENYYKVKITVPIGEFKYEFEKIIEKQ